MSIGTAGTEKRTENPSLAVFSTEDRLRKKLIELESTMAGIRNVLLGAQPSPGEEAKTSVATDGFFSEMQQRLRQDGGIVDSITAFACEVRDSLSES